MVAPDLTRPIPLLPWERQLIAELDITEDEYKQFVRVVQSTPWVRPAEYAHIPEVNNDAGLIVAIVSLVVGLASTAASFILAPKPRAPEARESRASSLDLASVSGRQRYAPSFGFDSFQDLAQYGSAVPIVFTRRDTTIGSGGLLISPPLIWSRVTSWGAFQVAQIMLLAGQGPIQRPDLAGIFLGNNSLDAIYDSSFQFYWAGGFGADSRLRGNTLRAGTLSTPPLPAANEEAFTAPSLNANADTAFCGSFSPQNQTQFGVYDGIPNGTPYRPNWEVVSVPDEASGSAKSQAITNQGKFVDEALAFNHPFGGFSNAVNAGMPGTGRNYASHVGIVSHNGYSMARPRELKAGGAYRTWTDAVTELRTVSVGDTIVLRLSAIRQEISPIPRNQPDNNPVDLTDVRSAVESSLQQYDELMNIGATFMIGRSTWQVIARQGGPYDTIEPETVLVTLRCLETWSTNNNRIGIVTDAIVDEATWIPYPADIRETFYPILRYNIGQVVNNRDCDVTEIGIKSQVWTRFNGITNFNTVPNAAKLADLNRRSVTVREGKNQSYGMRTSFFALDVRPANNESIRSRRNQGWETTPYFFAITGSTPQDIFTFIRIRHPRRGQFEFRFRPLPSTVFAEQGATSVFQLNGTTPYQEWQWANNTMGTFTIGGRGRFIDAADLPKLYTHSQMVARPDGLGTLRTGEFRDTGEPQNLGFTNVTLAVRATSSAPDPADYQRISNIIWEQLGRSDPANDSQNQPVGFRRTFSNWEYSQGGKSIRMELTLEVFSAPNLLGGRRNRFWRIVSTRVIDSSGFWTAGETFGKRARDVEGNQYSFNYIVNTTRQQWVQFPTPTADTRVWEQFSAIAEVSHYGDLITRSCDQGPEHEVVYVNESLSETSAPPYSNCAMLGLKIQASNSFSALDQLRVYLSNGIEVERLNDPTPGPSNLITDLLWYLLTNTDTGLGNIIDSSLIDRTQLERTGTYLRANQLFYDDVITEPLNLRSWLTEKAPSMLCYVAIRNGQISLNPSLPQNANGTISNTTPVPISALFTDGNIIEESFALEWLSQEERQMFQAAITYNSSSVNQFPERRTIVVRYDNSVIADSNELPLEQFDLSHVTHLAHARLAARYFLAVRRHITHSVTFRTLPYGLSLSPGDWIRVAVEMSPYRPTNNGIIRPDGSIVSTTTLADGNYDVWSWERGQTQVSQQQLQVANGQAQNLRNSLFSLRGANFNSRQVYQVEAIELDNDGIATIKASNFPTDASGISLIAQDVLNDATFVTL